MKVYYWSKFQAWGTYQSRDLEGGGHMPPPIPTVEVSEVALRRVKFHFDTGCPPYRLNSKNTYVSTSVTNSPIEFLALDDNEIVFGRIKDTTFDGNGTGSVGIVTCHHTNCDPGALALANGIGNLKSTRMLLE